MPVFSVPALQWLADVPVLPVYSPVKCSMCRYLELMHTAGSWASRMSIPHSKPMQNFIRMPALYWLIPTMFWNPVFRMPSAYSKKCAKKVSRLHNTASVSTVVTLLIFPRKHTRCLLLPDLMMRSFPLPVTWTNTSSTAWKLRMPKLIPGVLVQDWSPPTIILLSAVSTNSLLLKMLTAQNLRLRSSFLRIQRKLPILEIRLYIVSTARQQARSKLTLSALLMRN